MNTLAPTRSLRPWSLWMGGTRRNRSSIGRPVSSDQALRIASWSAYGSRFNASQHAKARRTPPTSSLVSLPRARCRSSFTSAGPIGRCEHARNRSLQNAWPWSPCEVASGATASWRPASRTACDTTWGESRCVRRALLRHGVPLEHGPVPKLPVRQGAQLPPLINAGGHADQLGELAGEVGLIEPAVAGRETGQ